MTIKLPDNFFFGAALSGPQTEGAYNVGGRLRSYWDMWSDQEISPHTALPVGRGPAPLP